MTSITLALVLSSGAGMTRAGMPRHASRPLTALMLMRRNLERNDKNETSAAAAMPKDMNNAWRRIVSNRFLIGGTLIWRRLMAAYQARDAGIKLP